jgi:hypothetical protein
MQSWRGNVNFQRRLPVLVEKLQISFDSFKIPSCHPAKA